MFAMFGATVLVPLLTGLSVSTTLLCAGLGTLLFHLITKKKVPAFLGSSFAYLGGFQAMATLNAGRYATMSDSDKLAYAMGGIVVAGLLYLVAGAAVQAGGVSKNICRGSLFRQINGQKAGRRPEGRRPSFCPSASPWRFPQAGNRKLLSFFVFPCYFLEETIAFSRHCGV